jgi:hypothetical protein
MKICYYKVASENLAHLVALAKCVGISAELSDVQNSAILLATIEDAMLQPDIALVLDVASLKEICQKDVLTRIAALMSHSSISLLLFTTEVDESTDLFLNILTRGVVLKSIHVDGAAWINFSRHHLSRELSSYSYPRKSAKAIALALRPGTKANLIMRLEESPSFVRVSTGKASVFVWSSLRIFNVFRPLAAEIEFEQAADEYIPAMIFLRFAFGDKCWHNPSPGAGIVIDDPLLTENYGFIKFPLLLKSARRDGYHVTLGFIPWNYWRSCAKKARMFINYSDCFSICAHGCDHTNNEFRTTDYEGLLNRNFVASRRMKRHRERTGIASEPLMVCPKEQYSLEAMRAFAASRQFLGLVCTACMPRDLRVPELTGADLLLPAQDSFYGFPVFKRHYSNGMSTGVFPMALFLGKPAILVEHHEFFRDGPEAAEEFVREIAAIRPDLKWRPLIETVTQTHARRRISKRSWDIRFFTDTFHLEHELEEAIDYRFLRRIPEATAVQSVLVDGSEVPFARKGSFLMFEAQVTHACMLAIKVVVTPAIPRKAYSPGLKYQASVALRRGLSEFRDNVIARNRFALSTSNRLFKSPKQKVR